MDVLKYIERRQFGDAGVQKNISDSFIEQMGCVPQKNYGIHSNIMDRNITASKFCRNKTNSHIIGSCTKEGDFILENTWNHFDSPNVQIQKSELHDDEIFDFSWAEPQMKLITASGDCKLKLCSLNPTGKLDEERTFYYGSPIKSVMFCPESSDIFCGASPHGYGTINIWDARIKDKEPVIDLHDIPYAPQDSDEVFGTSCVIFKNSHTVISSSDTEPIQVWDLRKCARRVKKNRASVPLMHYYNPQYNNINQYGFSNMILNPQATHLYGYGLNHIIYCFALDSTDTEKKPVCQYTFHYPQTMQSKISISNDGHYLFSGCENQVGVIWKTNSPHIEKPVFELNSLFGFNQNSEMCTSDWCPDSTCMKLVGVIDSMPVLLSVLTDVERNQQKANNCRSIKITRIPSYKYHQNTISNVVPKQPLEVSSTMNEYQFISQKASKSSPHTSSAVPNQIIEVIMPTASRKRKMQ